MWESPKFYYYYFFYFIFWDGHLWLAHQKTKKIIKNFGPLWNRYLVISSFELDIWVKSRVELNLAKNMETKWRDIRNTLGTWGTCWESNGNTMRTTKIWLPHCPQKKKNLAPWYMLPHLLATRILFAYMCSLPFLA